MASVEGNQQQRDSCRTASRKLNITRPTFPPEVTSPFIDNSNGVESLSPRLSTGSFKFESSEWKFIDECFALWKRSSQKPTFIDQTRETRTSSRRHQQAYRATFSQTEWESLYVEALYTIKHRIGRTVEANALTDCELYEYVKNAFNIHDDQHIRLMTKASQEKSPVVVLDVTVCEARHLEAKDANGYSDPYCMLGIVSKSKDDDDGVTKKITKKKKDSASAVDILAARYIKTTSVKKTTLNPIWNEKFNFDLADVATDSLHLDVWDHDDDSSVSDAASRLNQVKDLRGLERYFKQIAQSARCPKNDSNPATETLDDFLGTVDISIADVPSNGMDVWLDLKGRSAKSKVEGRVHLKLSLATKEDRRLPEDERQFESKQHCDLMLIFICHELKKSKESGDIWNGRVRGPAASILHQHAVQGDLTDAQQCLWFALFLTQGDRNISWWMALSRTFCEKTFDWSILLTSMDELDRKWNPKDVYKEEEFAIADHFDIFIRNSMDLIANTLIDSQASGSVREIQGMLVCLKRLYDTKLFKHCCQFKRELRSEIVQTIKKATLQYYQRVQNERRSKNLLTSEDFGGLVSRYDEMLLRTIACLNEARRQYNTLFQDMMGIDYYSIAYKKLRQLLMADISDDLYNLKQLVSEVEIDEKFSYESEFQEVEPVLKLFCTLLDFESLRSVVPTSEHDKLDELRCADIFASHFERWLTVFRHAAHGIVRESVSLDQIQLDSGTDEDVKLSWSAVVTVHIFNKIIGIWQRILEPISSVADPFTTIITQMVCDAAVSYAELMQAKLKKAGYYDDVGQFDVTQQLCIAINDVEHVRQALKPLSMVLGFNKRCAKETRSQILKSSEQKIKATIEQVAAYVTDKMRPDIKRLVFHLCWAPQKALSEDVIGELMNYLDSNLVTSNSNMLQANFDCILSSLWIQVLEEFDEVLLRPDEELRAATWMPGRLLESLHMLVEFFHADGKGLSMLSISSRLYTELYQQLIMLQTPTETLLEEYFAMKLKMQEETLETDNGTLSIRVYYNYSAKLLTVEVLGAKQLLPQDSNGLSDPYVTVELHPAHMFPQVQPRQTKVAKKTLNPTFSDSSTYQVSEEQCRRRGACVVFTVMDHDVMSANDFAGEVFFGLSSTVGEHHRRNSLQNCLVPTTLPIINSPRQPSRGDQRTRKRGLLAALAMKYAEPSTIEFVNKRLTIDD